MGANAADDSGQEQQDIDTSTWATFLLPVKTGSWIGIIFLERDVNIIPCDSATNSSNQSLLVLLVG